MRNEGKRIGFHQDFFKLHTTEHSPLITGVRVQSDNHTITEAPDKWGQQLSMITLPLPDRDSFIHFNNFEHYCGYQMETLNFKKKKSVWVIYRHISMDATIMSQFLQYGCVGVKTEQIYILSL